jgi:hypothetical protein
MRTWNSFITGIFLKRSHPIFAALFAVLLGCGCVSQKPLPFAYGGPLPVRAGGPTLAVVPAESLRPAKDPTDKALRIPECVDTVTVKELQGIGLFSTVSLCTNEVPKNGYVLRTQVKDLRWDVPKHKAIVATAAGVTLVTGALGGTIYGFTGAEVLGHASVHFHLEDAQTSKTLLDRDFTALEKRKTSKFACDTPATVRDVSAGALRIVFDQFEADLKQLHLDQPGAPVQSAAKAGPPPTL